MAQMDEKKIYNNDTQLLSKVFTINSSSHLHIHVIILDYNNRKSFIHHWTEQDILCLTYMYLILKEIYCITIKASSQKVKIYSQCTLCFNLLRTAAFINHKVMT